MRSQKNLNGTACCMVTERHKSFRNTFSWCDHKRTEGKSSSGFCWQRRGEETDWQEWRNEPNDATNFAAKWTTQIRPIGCRRVDDWKPKIRRSKRRSSQRIPRPIRFLTCISWKARGTASVSFVRVALSKYILIENQDHFQAPELWWQRRQPKAARYFWNHALQDLSPSYMREWGLEGIGEDFQDATI